MSHKVGYKREWFRDWFGEDYLTVYNHRNLRDAQQLVQLILKTHPLDAEMPVLDVGCGHGRHAQILAELGLRVIGLDLSPVMLRVAKSTRKHARYPLLVRADKSALPFRRTFQAAFSLFTSFGYFESDIQNQAVLHEYAAVLNTEGLLVVDFLNPDDIVRRLQPESTREEENMLINEKRWIDRRRVCKEITIEKDNTVRRFYESVRLYNLDEMKRMLQNAGFRITNIFGEYDGREYHSESKRMILFGSKL